MELERTRPEKELDPLAGKVIACAMDVHTALGPGLLEATYEQCLAHELSLAGLPFELQCPLPVAYKGIKLACGFRVDVFVDKRLIIELKSVDEILPIHHAQLLTYLRLAKCRTGLLINFNVTHLRNGLKRMVI